MGRFDGYDDKNNILYEFKASNYNDIQSHWILQSYLYVLLFDIKIDTIIIINFITGKYYTILFENIKNISAILYWFQWNWKILSIM